MYICINEDINRKNINTKRNSRLSTDHTIYSTLPRGRKGLHVGREIACEQGLTLEHERAKRNRERKIGASSPDSFPPDRFALRRSYRMLDTTTHPG